MDVNKLTTLAMAVCGTVMVRAVEFPNPAEFNPTWESAKPGSSCSTDLPTAALLGNGSLGAVNGVIATCSPKRVCGNIKGGRFRLVEPRQQAYNNKMPEGWVHGKTRNSGEATLDRDFKPGEVVLLR